VSFANFIWFNSPILEMKRFAMSKWRSRTALTCAWEKNTWCIWLTPN
jgi:hypothetical protein